MLMGRFELPSGVYKAPALPIELHQLILNPIGIIPLVWLGETITQRFDECAESTTLPWPALTYTRFTMHLPTKTIDTLCFVPSYRKHSHSPQGKDGVGFEPTGLLHPTVFKTVALIRSATHPNTVKIGLPGLEPGPSYFRVRFPY